jgi:hypothetical protein
MKSTLIGLFFIFCFVILVSSSFAQTLKPQKIDEFGDLNCESAWARLDGFAISAQNEPNAKIHIIFYGGKRYASGYIYNKRIRKHIQIFSLPQHGEARTTVVRWRDYLVNNRGIDPERIVLADGGYRENHSVEFWLVPASAKPPEITPTLEEKDIKFRKGKARDKDCGELG